MNKKKQTIEAVPTLTGKDLFLFISEQSGKKLKPEEFREVMAALEMAPNFWTLIDQWLKKRGILTVDVFAEYRKIIDPDPAITSHFKNAEIKQR